MTEIYLDTANIGDIKKGLVNPIIKGFTTNPSLMRAAGITDYKKFAIEQIKMLKDLRPDTNISLEVFADDYNSMYYQACKINEWSLKYDFPVFVKIPITNTQGISSVNLIRDLNSEDIRVNVTAVFLEIQTRNIMELFANDPTLTQDLIISVFAGRISDTSVNPVTAMRYHHDIIFLDYNWKPNVKLLWASCRDIYSYYEAIVASTNIITMPLAMINKLEELQYKNLKEYSLETVQQFYNDAKESGYHID